MTELLVVVLVLAALAGLLLPTFLRQREEARQVRCRNNLNQLAKGYATYLNEHGDGRFLRCPLGRTLRRNTYNGAEWMASLYWTGVVPDPGVFICPSTEDTNRDGLDIGSDFQASTFTSGTISYAGLHYYSLTDTMGHPVGGAIRDDYPPDRAVASDDTQGDINHNVLGNRGIAVLFLDSHVEFWWEGDPDFPRTVGDRRGLLGALAN